MNQAAPKIKFGSISTQEFPLPILMGEFMMDHDRGEGPEARISEPHPEVHSEDGQHSF